MLKPHSLLNIGDISAIHTDNDLVSSHNMDIHDLCTIFCANLAKIGRVNFAWRGPMYSLCMESEKTMEVEANEFSHQHLSQNVSRDHSGRSQGSLWLDRNWQGNNCSHCCYIRLLKTYYLYEYWYSTVYSHKYGFLLKTVSLYLYLAANRHTYIS